MKILLSDSGAGWATYDVYRGLHESFTKAGVDVVRFSLQGRIEKMKGYLDWLWESTHRAGPRATAAEWMFNAGVNVIERALYHNVDWVVLVSALLMHREILVMMKRAHIKIATIFTESPNDDADQLNWAEYSDVCWVNDKGSVDVFKQAGIQNVRYYQHAYDPAVHFPGKIVNPGVSAHDVVFVGTGWYERIRLFEAIDWTGINFGLYGTWDLMHPKSPVRKYLCPNIVRNEATADLYRKAKIGINLHRTSVDYSEDGKHVATGYSINPRCYELAACGAFFISDYRPELKDIFGDLVPTFKTPEELQDKIHYYLKHEDERLDIASRLPQCVAGHTFDKRVEGILEVLNDKSE